MQIVISNNVFQACLYKLQGLFFRVFFVLASVLLPHSYVALADGVPQIVQNAAVEMSRDCRSSAVNSKRAILSVYAIVGGGTVYVLDGSQTPCGPSASSCGTGGCPLKLYRDIGSGTKLIFNQNVFSWEVTTDGKAFHATLHSTHCGGPSKAPYCDVTVNTRSGKKNVVRGR